MRSFAPLKTSSPSIYRSNFNCGAKAAYFVWEMHRGRFALLGDCEKGGLAAFLSAPERDQLRPPMV
jgi:hypothetical protein